MTSVQITSQVNIGLDQLLSGVAQLETADLEQFVGQVNLLLAQRKVPNLPQRETVLLEQINQGLPEQIQQRYDALQAKLHEASITTEEHQELLGLIDTVEQASADRLQALIELAQLRQISLDALMNQLDIHHPPVYA
jgi:DNA-binding ferritin-like protein (Dps family)